MYGLRQSGHNWNEELHAKLNEMGFTRLNSDFGLYIHAETKSILSVYVDNMLLATETPEYNNKFCQQLRESFKIEEFGPARSILGMRARREQSDNGRVFTLNQQHYTVYKS